MTKESHNLRRRQSRSSIRSKGRSFAFLHFLYKFSQTQELMPWIDGAMLLSKFELYLQGTYEVDRYESLDATDSNEDRDAKFFEEQAQNLLSDRFTKDEWSEMANYIRTRRKKTILMTTNRLHSRSHILLLSFCNCQMLLKNFSQTKNKNESSLAHNWVTKSCQLWTDTETLQQSLKRYLSKQEYLDPYQEDDHEEDDTDDHQEDHHLKGDEDDNLFVEEPSDSEVTTNTSNKTNTNNNNQGSSNRRNLNPTHKLGPNRMIPLLWQDIQAILGASAFKIWQTFQRAQQEPLTHLDVKHMSTNALMSPFEVLEVEEASSVILANQPLVREQEGLLAIAATIGISSLLYGSESEQYGS
jgi:hypothetical protein